MKLSPISLIAKRTPIDKRSTEGGILPPSQIISFTSGPNIRVILEFEELKLKRTYLSLSEGFECEIILQTAVRDGKVMQDFNSESFPIGGPHSQMVKGPPVGNDSELKGCVNLPSPTAVSRMIGWGEDQLKTDLLTFLENYTKQQTQIFPLPLDTLSPFRQKVLNSLQRVPFGSVVTYGELADLSGFPRAARAVGSTCNHNPYPLFIPCHRVIAQGRKPGGFAFNLEIKKRLLDFEKNYLLGSGNSKIMRS